MSTLPTTPEREILTEREFREDTMGCFYQDELRKHDRAMRKKLKAQATELLGEVEKIIGDDESRFYRENKNALKHDVRNELRAEQRKQLASLRSKWKKTV